jgi:hypothetical protein
VSARGRVRAALSAAGGTLGAGRVRDAAARPVAHPFGQSRRVEPGAARTSAVTAVPAPDGVAYLASIQRYVVDGHVGLIPVVRAWVSAAVFVRRAGALEHVTGAAEEILVVPGGRADPRLDAAIAAAALPVVWFDGRQEAHPLADRWAAVCAIEERRAACARTVAARVLADGAGGPLVVEGPVAPYAGLPGGARAVGVVERHETLYLGGEDLVAALTLPPGHRSKAFAWSRAVTLSWYLRLWPWNDDDLLHGLIRVERADVPDPAGEADRVSGWLLADRAPIAGPEPQWDRRLYPLHAVEAYLRAHAGGWR